MALTIQSLRVFGSGLLSLGLVFFLDGFTSIFHGFQKVRGADQRRRNTTVAAITAEQAARIRSILASDDPRTDWAIADMKIGERSIERELLLGSHWPGVIPLNDEQAIRQFTAYVIPRS